MDVDISPISNKSIKSGIERMLELGRELLQMSLRLEKKYQNVNDEIIAENRKMMEVNSSFCCFTLKYTFVLISGSIQSVGLLKSMGKSSWKATFSV